MMKKLIIILLFTMHSMQFSMEKKSRNFFYMARPDFDADCYSKLIGPLVVDAATVTLSYEKVSFEKLKVCHPDNYYVHDYREAQKKIVELKKAKKALDCPYLTHESFILDQKIKEETRRLIFARHILEYKQQVDDAVSDQHDLQALLVFYNHSVVDPYLKGLGQVDKQLDPQSCILSQQDQEIYDDSLEKELLLAAKESQLIKFFSRVATNEGFMLLRYLFEEGYFESETIQKDKKFDELTLLIKNDAERIRLQELQALKGRSVEQLENYDHAREAVQLISERLNITNQQSDLTCANVSAHNKLYEITDSIDF